MSYLDYLHRTLPLIERGKTSGSWWWPSPSVMLFVADSDARAFVTEALADPIHLEGTELFDGFAFLACPTRPVHPAAAAVPARAARLPGLDHPPRARGPGARRARREPPAVASACARKGGTRYAGYGAVPFTPADWADHYGPATWARLAAAKRAFDPGTS